jgi:hypothetical protein
MFLGKLFDTEESVVKADDESIDQNQALEEAFSEIVIARTSSTKKSEIAVDATEYKPEPLAEKKEETLAQLFQKAEEALKAENTFSSIVIEEDESDNFVDVEDKIALDLRELPEIDKATRMNLVDKMAVFASAPSEEDKETSSAAIAVIAPPTASEIPLDEHSFLSQFKINIDLPEYAELNLPQLSNTTATQESESTAAFMIPQSSMAPPEGWKYRKVAKASTMRPVNTYALPEGEKMLAWQEDFNIEVYLMPQKEQPGYIFSVLLKPHPNVNVERLKQNFYFLIDRSSSIEKHRFTTFKKGVVKALSQLQEGDAFNIFVFDNHITSLSDKTVPFSAKSLKMAEEFLEKEAPGGRYAAADVPNYLEKLIPSSVSTADVHTAILLTDGKSSLSGKKQQKAIKRWMEKNQGRVSLYTAAVGQENNLVFLDLISSCNGGELLYSDTHASFGRKFSKLLLDLKNPIAKDLSVEVVSSNPEADITIYPLASYLPALYQNKPYLIQGTIDELSDFTLLLQGQNRDLKLQVQKTVSFSKAGKGLPALAKKWESKQASIYYEKFLVDGSDEALSDAKKHLKDLSQ